MVIIVNDDRSTDYPPYTVTLYPSGNIFVNGGDSRMGSSQATASPAVCRKFLRDANTFNVYEFEKSLHVDGGPMPDNTITIRDGGKSVTIVYTPILDERTMTRALERGDKFARQAAIIYLLGQRVLDLTGRDLR